MDAFFLHLLIFFSSFLSLFHLPSKIVDCLGALALRIYYHSISLNTLLTRRETFCQPTVLRRPSHKKVKEILEGYGMEKQIPFRKAWID